MEECKTQMPLTVWGAFDAFRRNTVDLDPNQTAVARASRDNLVDQLVALGGKVVGFPQLTGKHMYFGSFARRTKIRPIDDIDIMILLDGEGTRLKPGYSSLYEYWLRIEDKTAPLAAFPDDCGYVNSTRVLNRIRDSLKSVSQYSSAEIHKTQQAVTLNLKSYSWVFDVVPAIGVKGENGTVCYIIPDGFGDWIKTDPRVDQKNITDANDEHDLEFIPTMRVLKYWNGRTSKPRLPSYYFETLVINTFRYAPTIQSFPLAVKYFFQVAPTYLTSSCPDPKGLGPDLDEDIERSTKEKVEEAMKKAADDAWYAVYYQQRGYQKDAINRWSDVFGPQFPSYG